MRMLEPDFYRNLDWGEKRIRKPMGSNGERRSGFLCTSWSFGQIWVWVKSGNWHNDYCLLAQLVTVYMQGTKRNYIRWFESFLHSIIMQTTALACKWNVNRINFSEEWSINGRSRSLPSNPPASSTGTTDLQAEACMPWVWPSLDKWGTICVFCSSERFHPRTKQWAIL